MFLGSEPWISEEDERIDFIGRYYTLSVNTICIESCDIARNFSLSAFDVRPYRPRQATRHLSDISPCQTRSAQPRVVWFDPNFAKVPRFGSNDRTEPEPIPNDFLGIYWGECSSKHGSPSLVGSATGLGASNGRLLARRPASTASQMRPLRRSHLRTVEASMRAMDIVAMGQASVRLPVG